MTTMGNSQSKRASTASSITLINKNDPNQLQQDISAPETPRHIWRLSELIDPADLVNSDDEEGQPSGPKPDTGNKKRVAIIKSPSGQPLSASEFMQREDRPLSVPERQASIRRRFAEQVAAAESEIALPEGTVHVEGIARDDRVEAVVMDVEHGQRQDAVAGRVSPTVVTRNTTLGNEVPSSPEARKVSKRGCCGWLKRG